MLSTELILYLSDFIGLVYFPSRHTLHAPAMYDAMHAFSDKKNCEQQNVYF